MTAPDILCAGMIVVDVIVDGLEAMPRPGETGRVSSVTLASGGDAINEAFAIAKLGNNVGLMGLIGQDSQGQFIRDRCVHYGVSTEGLHADPERSTTTSIVLLDKSGERSFLSERNASIGAYGPEHVDLDIIRPGLKALSIGSIFTSQPFDTKALAPLLRKAKSVGAITVADMVMDQQGYGLDGLAEAWEYLDYVVPSELEAQIFTGSTDPKAIAADFRRRGVKNVILKRGSQGVVGFVDGEEVACPAFSVPVIDTTGAGDNFVGGLVHCLVRKMPLADTLRFASAVAGLSVQAVGAGAGLKDLAQVERFLAEQRVQA
ncbi:carbohydrate kinase family protein [Rhizobium sp. 2MFCol3.1]|uniref:carbohydrate kinase family protein n=1 Tax=Rhizobium sp. 2MFCol3.1 TaxID=1246459 RepID=UPI0003AAC250|nr:carbohydrate kinase family protein [Rhizobium sp. 2MFCol3.1]